MKHLASISFLRQAFVCLVGIVLLVSENSLSQGIPNRIPYTAFGFLTSAPDARGAALGETGVALSPDANAAYWNASKLAFAERDFGASVSYTPWLRNIIDDSWIGYVSVYKKLPKGQAVSISVNTFKSYADLRSVVVINPIRSTDNAFNATYAKKFGENFSMGVTLKYINSKFDENVIINGKSLSSAGTAAGDISAYYRKQLIKDSNGKNLSWSIGAVLSDVGSKVNYGTGVGTSEMIPTMLKIGGGLSAAPNRNHSFNFVLDARKLLVPTPSSGAFNNKTVLQSMLSSFSDAPGGLKEELQEVIISGGAEYWFKDAVALRGGYFYENKNKGDRKYFTAGAGIRILKSYGIDGAYLFPIAKGSPLAQTFRISVSAYFGKKTV